MSPDWECPVLAGFDQLPENTGRSHVVNFIKAFCMWYTIYNPPQYDLNSGLHSPHGTLGGGSQVTG